MNTQYNYSPSSSSALDASHVLTESSQPVLLPDAPPHCEVVSFKQPVQSSVYRMGRFYTGGQLLAVTIVPHTRGLSMKDLCY
jgi:hypothetical protein